MLKSMTLDKSQIKWLCSSQWSIVCDITHIKWKREQSENSTRTLSQAHTYRISLFSHTHIVYNMDVVLSCVTEQQPEFTIQLHFFANLHNPYLGLIIAPLSLSTLFSRDCLFFLPFFFSPLSLRWAPWCCARDFLFNFYSIKWHQFHPSVAIFSFSRYALRFFPPLLFSLSFIWSFHLSHIVWLNVVVYDGS